MRYHADDVRIATLAQPGGNSVSAGFTHITFVYTFTTRCTHTLHVTHTRFTYSTHTYFPTTRYTFYFVPHLVHYLVWFTLTHFAVPIQTYCRLPRTYSTDPRPSHGLDRQAWVLAYAVLLSSNWDGGILAPSPPAAHTPCYHTTRPHCAHPTPPHTFPLPTPPLPILPHPHPMQLPSPHMCHCLCTSFCCHFRTGAGHLAGVSCPLPHHTATLPTHARTRACRAHRLQLPPYAFHATTGRAGGFMFTRRTRPRGCHTAGIPARGVRAGSCMKRGVEVGGGRISGGVLHWEFWENTVYLMQRRRNNNRGFEAWRWRAKLLSRIKRYTQHGMCAHTLAAESIWQKK